MPGLDESTVRVAVIADVETGGTADDLFRDAWSAAKAWELEVNSRGGIGDRDVIVATLDTALTNHRAVLDVVCNGAYFAIVGAQSLNDYDGAEMLGTEDCNIADFSGDVHGALRAESANTFIPNPIYNDVRQSGPAQWLAEEYPDTVENVTTFWFEELQLRNETERLFEMLDGLGFTVRTIDTDLDEGPSERILTRFTELESEAIVWNADPDRLIDLLRDFRENEVDLTWVLCEFTCYSQEFLEDGGLAVEGVYTWIPHTPIDSPTADDEFIDYRFFLKQFAPDVGWSEVGMLMDVGETVFGMLGGGRRRRRSVAAAGRRVMRDSRSGNRLDDRLETKDRKLSEEEEDLAEMLEEFEAKELEIVSEFNDKAQEVESYEVGLEKADISIDDIMLVWLPSLA